MINKACPTVAGVDVRAYVAVMDITQKCYQSLSHGAWEWGKKMSKYWPTYCPSYACRGTCRCPGCHSNWPHDIPEIEDEVDANNGSPSQSRNPPSPPSQKTQRKRTRHGAYKH